jgi:acetyl-CoA C-acetyltransferase
MYEFGTTVEQMAMVSVKNHVNALYNPYAQKAKRLSIQQVRESPMVASPLTMEDICTMSDGAAVCILASEKLAERTCGRPVKITGVGSGSDAMRMADRPHGHVPLLPHERESDYLHLKYPGVHSFRAGRMAAKQAYKMAGIRKPLEQLHFMELHDAYTSSEIQTYEDLGLCKYGQGGAFVEKGIPFMPDLDYGMPLEEHGRLPVNPSGGLLACGHPVGATGLMQAVFAFWQLQGTIPTHLGSPALQIKKPRRGLIHSHAGTGTYVTVSIMEAT